MPPSVARAELPMDLAQAIKKARSHSLFRRFSADCCPKITHDLTGFRRIFRSRGRRFSFELQ
jgi:hypothetical protein